MIDITKFNGHAEGMSLRDYFATHCELGNPDNYSVQFGESLLGRLLPALGRVEQLTWWADYRAAMRYLEADAMIRAREKGGAA